MVGGIVGLVAGRDGIGERGLELAGGDLFGRGVGEAELAVGEVAFFGAGGWTEGAAEDRPMLIQIAGAGGGIEDGAGLVVGEVLEGFGGLVAFGEDAGSGIARE